MNESERPSQDAMRNAARVILQAAIRIEQDRLADESTARSAA